jgi:hypothetical protein
LRFAVQPPAQRRASPRSHGVPRRDVPGGVHVSVAAVSASPAPEDSLALASLPVDSLALRARLARVPRINLLNPASGLVLQPGSERGPGAVQDGPVQSSEVADVVAFLAGDGASYLHGAVLMVGGGGTA